MIHVIKLFKRNLNFNIQDNVPFYITRGHITKTYRPDYHYNKLPDKLATYCKITKTHHNGVHNLYDEKFIYDNYKNIDDISRRFEANLRMNVSTRDTTNEYKHICVSLIEFAINEMITQQVNQNTLSNENIILEYNSEVEGHWCNDLNMFSTRFFCPLIIRGHKPLEPFTNTNIVYPMDCEQYHASKNIIFHLGYLKKNTVTNNCLEDHPGFVTIPDRIEPKFKKQQIIGRVPESCYPRFIVVKAFEQYSSENYNSYLDCLAAGNIVVAFASLASLMGKLFRQRHDSDGWGYGHGLEMEKPLSTTVLCINRYGCSLLNYQLNTLSTLNNEVGIMNQSWSSEYFDFTTPSNIINCTKHLLSLLHKVYYYD